jgi:hypothetical protein
MRFAMRCTPDLDETMKHHERCALVRSCQSNASRNFREMSRCQDYYFKNTDRESSRNATEHARSEHQYYYQTAVDRHTVLIINHACAVSNRGTTSIQRSNGAEDSVAS